MTAPLAWTYIEQAPVGPLLAATLPDGTEALMFGFPDGGLIGQVSGQTVRASSPEECERLLMGAYRPFRRWNPDEDGRDL